MRRYASNSLQPLLLEGANTNARSNSFEERFNKYIRNTKLRFLAAEGKLNQVIMQSKTEWVVSTPFLLPSPNSFRYWPNVGPQYKNDFCCLGLSRCITNKASQRGSRMNPSQNGLLDLSRHAKFDLCPVTVNPDVCPTCYFPCLIFKPIANHFELIYG